MKRTKSMIYRETAEADELYTYAINNQRTVRHFECCVDNLNRKTKKGIYDREKAIDIFYYVANTASAEYKREFGYNFSVADRFTVAVDLRDMYESDHQENSKPELSVITSANDEEVKTA